MVSDGSNFRRPGYALFRAALKRYHKAGGTLDEAVKYLCLPGQTKEPPQNKEVQQFLFTRQMMTPAMAVALTAKEFGAEFWPLWDEIGGKSPTALSVPTTKTLPAGRADLHAGLFQVEPG